MTVDGGQVMDKKKAEDVYKLMESRKGEQFAQELLVFCQYVFLKIAS